MRAFKWPFVACGLKQYAQCPYCKGFVGFQVFAGSAFDPEAAAHIRHKIEEVDTLNPCGHPVLTVDRYDGIYCPRCSQYYLEGISSGESQTEEG